MVVIHRTRGGSYIIAEMDGTVLKEKVGAFRVLPHMECYKPIELLENIHYLIDLMAEQLKNLVEKEDLMEGHTEHFIFNVILDLQLLDDDNVEIFDPEDEEIDSNEEHWEDDPLLEEEEDPDKRPMTRVRHRAKGTRKDLDHG